MGSLNLFLLCLLPAVIYSEVVRFPLRHSKSSQFLLGRGAVASEILRRNRACYYGEISIGTPAQNFNVTFSTEISKTWVPAADCSSQFCARKNRYSSAKSRTYEQNGESADLSSTIGRVKGILSTDNLNIAGLGVTGQTFVEAAEVSGNIQSFPQIDGVVGLGSPSFSDNSLISSMVKQGLIKKKVFSVFLKGTGISNEGVGEIVFGGANPDRQIENFTYVQAMIKGQWMFPVKRVYVGNEIIDRGGSNAIVEISEKSLKGPKKVVMAIFEAIGAKLDAYSRDYIVDCSKIDKLPTVDFKIGTSILSLDAKYYITKYKTPLETVCGTVFLPKNQETWTLGIPFINKFYTQFDLEKNRIGFAEAA